jgi:hypothetical protein
MTSALSNKAARSAALFFQGGSLSKRRDHVRRDLDQQIVKAVPSLEVAERRVAGFSEPQFSSPTRE